MPLSEEIAEALLADDPDPVALVALLEAGGLSPQAALAVFKRAVAQLNASLFPPLNHLELIHTEGCNLACTYCFEKNILGYRRMPLNVITAAIDLFFEYSGDVRKLEIVHFGGEPTLNFPAICHATEYAERKALDSGKTVEFEMTSNGTLLTDKLVDYLGDRNIRVLLSLDGLEASHDKFRIDKKGRGSFRRAMRGLQLLKRRQPWIGAKITVMPENAPRLFDDVLGLQEEGVNQFLIGHATGVQWADDQVATYGEQLRAIRDWYLEQRRIGAKLRIADFDDPKSETSFFGCQAGRNSVAIGVNGEISPCSKILGLNNKKILAKLGDVMYGITHIRNRLELVTCSSLRTACANEGIADEFQGGCFASNYSDRGNLYWPSRQDHSFSVLERRICSGCSSRQ